MLCSAVLQGVPVRDQDHGVHRAEAERCALHSAVAGCAAELWHERDPAPHEEPPIPRQLHEVGFAALESQMQSKWICSTVSMSPADT